MLWNFLFLMYRSYCTVKSIWRCDRNELNGLAGFIPYQPHPQSFRLCLFLCQLFRAHSSWFPQALSQLAHSIFCKLIQLILSIILRWRKLSCCHCYRLFLETVSRLHAIWTQRIPIFSILLFYFPVLLQWLSWWKLDYSSWVARPNQ